MSMPRSYGDLDSRQLEEGDDVFLRMNTRLRPNQLQPGEVALSKNGRMETDGAWRVRNGLDFVSGFLTAKALTLPFDLPQEIEAASRSSNTVTLTVTGHGLTNGNEYTVEGVQLGFSVDDPTSESGGGQAPDGAGGDLGSVTWQVDSYTDTGNQTANIDIEFTSASAVTTDGNVSVTVENSSAVGQPTLPPGDLTTSPLTVSLLALGADTYTVYATYDGGDNEKRAIGTFDITTSQSGDDPNGDFTITVSDANTLTYSDSGADETFVVDSDSVIGDAPLNTSVEGIYGSCVYSDPGDSNKNYIIIAQNSNATAINLEDPSDTTSISYPAGVTTDQPVELLQVFDKIVLFRDQYTPIEWDGDLSGSPAFVAAEDGTFTQPTELTDSTCDAANGVVSFDNGSAHNLADGDVVTIVSSDDTELNDFSGTEVQVEVTGANTFTFPVPGLPDFTGQSTKVIARLSVGGGFIHAPAPPWGVHHNRRLWCPYYYDPATDETTQATDREVRDEIVASQTLKTDTFDRLYDQLRPSGGTADFLVGLHPFTQDTLIGFNRNTIHLIQGVSGELNDVKVRFLTDEIGCLARKTIVTYANQILFLSDDGVYSISFVDEYNIRGTGVPLTEPVQTLIQDINPALADQSVAVYHDNRYWLAYPKGSGATGNNSLLVYNFLNQGWESIDSYSDEDFLISDLHIAKSGGVNKLYAVSSQGGVHLIDGKEEGDDLITSQVGQDNPVLTPIESSFISRQYDMNTIHRKKFVRAEVQFQSSDQNESDATIESIVSDPDTTDTLGTISGSIGDVLSISEDSSVRVRIGNRRGFAAQLKITPTTGKPRVRAAKVDGTISFRSTTSVN